MLRRQRKQERKKRTLHVRGKVACRSAAPFETFLLGLPGAEIDITIRNPLDRHSLGSRGHSDRERATRRRLWLQSGPPGVVSVRWHGSGHLERSRAASRIASSGVLPRHDLSFDSVAHFCPSARNPDNFHLAKR